MPVLTKHRFTTRDYYRMAETGVLRPGARVELLDGEIIDMSPIAPFHGGVTTCLNQRFTTSANGRWLVSVQNPLHLDEYSEPEPDLMLVAPARGFYKDRHPQPRDVFLLIEVADTSIGYDRSEKLAAYGRAGIPEVWIVNLNDLVLEIYREPHLTGYGVAKTLRSGEKASPLAFPDVEIHLDALLK